MKERGNALLKWLDYACGIPLAQASALVRRSSGSKELVQSLQEPRIGVICLGAIGDLLLVSGLLEGIRRVRPKAHIEVIASKANSAVLDLLPQPDIGTSFSVKALGALTRHIRNARYDLLIDTSQWARLGNILANISGARFTAGFATPGQHRGVGYDFCVAHRADVHELENFLSLGRAIWPQFSGIPSLALPGWSRNRNALVFCHLWPAPGRGRELKQWPAEQWAQLITQLTSSGYEVALSGGKNDRSATENFARRYLDSQSGVKILAGELTLAQLARAMNTSAGLVSVNTGIMHLGAVLGVPTVGLHGPTNPLRWGPVGKRALALVPHAGHNCYLNLGFEYPENATNNMASLPVSDVTHAMDRLGILGKSSVMDLYEDVFTSACRRL